MAETRKTVLITGCSSGIGESLALEFAKRNYRVFATARQATSLASLVAKSPNIEPLSLEVHNAESIAALKDQIIELTGGKLDVLVNNAGRNYTVPALDIDFDEVQYTFEVNVFSVMRMCQAFAPLLIEAKGTILQIGSVAGVMPYVFGSVYNASKGALHQYSNTLRVELAPFDVRVVTVVTGGVQSKIARTERTLPPGSVYEPINEQYLIRVGHSQSGNSMPSEAFAKSVVKQLLGSNRKLIWEGNASWIVWFMQRFLSITYMDLYFWRTFGLAKLRGTWKGINARR